MGPRRAKLVLALFSLYAIWGSTYVAIAIAVRTIPPLLMACVRLVTAGALLYAALRARGELPPSAKQWRGAAASGALLLFGGQGLVVLAAKRLPSSIIALVIALTPLFVAVLPWVFGAPRPTGRVGGALAAGLVGVSLLVRAPGSGLAEDPMALVMVIGAVLSWSVGTLLAHRLPLPVTPMMNTAAQMLAGGALLGVCGIARGELAQVDADQASAASLGALAYLITFGSIVGFGAYQWLLRNTAPTLATSYAYVNPLVALVLGHLVERDPIGPEVLVPSALIIGAVVLLLEGSMPRARPVDGRLTDR